jgi:hypothetical protein
VLSDAFGLDLLGRDPRISVLLAACSFARGAHYEADSTG